MKTSTMVMFLFFLMIINCKRNSTGINHKPDGLTLKIVDEDNRSISDVDLHYIFNIGDFEIIRNPTLSFSFEKADTGTLKIFYPISAKELILFKDYEFLPGIHSIIMNSSKHKLTNGIYHYSLELKNRIIEDYFPIIYDNIDTLLGFHPLIQSDNQGRIFISYGCFHIGENFGNDQIKKTIGDSNRWLFKSKTGFWVTRCRLLRSHHDKRGSRSFI